ncbi:MAG: hypothetical protein II225_01320 [Ruminococcus sp.]|nr:hypothetical protein [Ruminococcus sp.]
MKKRILSLLICAVLVLSFSGCTGEKVNTDSKSTTTASEPTVPLEIEGYTRIDSSYITFESPLFEKVKLTKGYESLDTDGQRAAYKLIDSYVMYISNEKIDGDYKVLPIDMRGITLSQAELHLIISAYSMDHPEIFWIESKFAYYTTDKQTFLQLNSGLSADEIMADAVKMKKTFDSMFKGVKAQMSQYDRELWLHNALNAKCEYADTKDEKTDDFRIYTCVGALVDGVAVCEGYSRAMQILLSAAGIDCYYVLGVGNETLHMWNTVKIDSDWYFLDATWNDNDSMGAEFDYFNLNTDQILKDHTISPLYWELTEEEVCGNETTGAANFNLFVPECVKKDWGFYSQKSIPIDGFDDVNLQKIADAMTEAVNTAQKVVYIYIDPEYLDYEQAVDNLFYSGDYAIFTCISKANESLADVKIKEDYVSAVESPEFSVVTVYIEY